MQDVLNEQSEFFEFISSEIVNNRISHAYLIESFDYENIDVLITEFLKFLLCSNKVNNHDCDCKTCHLIQEKQYPDIRYISADGSFIKKEQLLNLMSDFKGKSILDNKQIYVIEDATKLNTSSANTMLKFLEEPEENIIAILIANNKYKVIDTILSRCQVISLNDNKVKEYDDDIKQLFDIICNRNKNFIYYDLLLEIIPDRSTALEKLKLLESYLFDNKDNKLLDLDLNSVISIISIIERILERLEFNVNYKLTLDDMLVSIWEVIK